MITRTNAIDLLSNAASGNNAAIKEHASRFLAFLQEYDSFWCVTAAPHLNKDEPHTIHTGALLGQWHLYIQKVPGGAHSDGNQTVSYSGHRIVLRKITGGASCERTPTDRYLKLERQSLEKRYPQLRPAATHLQDQDS